MVSITKLAIPIVGVILFGLFLREATATSVGSAGRSFGSGLGSFFEGIGGMGESINRLGTGIGSGITGILSPIQTVGSWFNLFNENSPANQSGATNPSIGGVVSSGSTSTPNTPTASTSNNTSEGSTPSQVFSGYTSPTSFGWGG